MPSQKFYKIAFFVLLAIILIGGTFYLGMRFNSQSKKVTPTPSPVSEEVEVTTSPEEETVVVKDLDEVQETIRSAISSDNTQPLESYLNDPVNIVIYASECCGPKDKSETIKNLDYVKDGDNWNFDQSNQTVKDLKAKSVYFDGAYVGVASNEKAIGFKLNESNMISDIVMVASYKLITQ